MASPPPDGLVLIATKCIAADLADDWAAWYRDEHLGSLVGGPIANASRWRLDGAPPPGGPGPGHSHVTRLEIEGDPSAGARDLRRRLDERRASGRIHPAHAITSLDVWAAHGPAVAGSDIDGACSALIVAEVMCTDPDLEPEWDRWYDDQHIVDMMATDAFAQATRWRRIPRRGIGCDHLTVYEVVGFEAAEAVRRSAAAMPGIVAAGRKHRCHTGGPTMALDAD